MVITYLLNGLFQVVAYNLHTIPYFTYCLNIIYTWNHAYVVPVTNNATSLTIYEPLPIRALVVEPVRAVLYTSCVPLDVNDIAIVTVPPTRRNIIFCPKFEAVIVGSVIVYAEVAETE